MSKIALVGARDIALDRLLASDANVRRIKAGISVEKLAKDVASRGLLQSLSVRPVPDGDRAETGKFAVSAGGRRSGPYPARRIIRDCRSSLRDA